MDNLSDFDLLKKALQDYDKEQERSALGEIGTGIAGGVAGQLPRMVGQAARAFADEGSDVDLWGKEVVQDADERLQSPEYRLNPEAHGGVTNAFAAGAQSLPASLATMAAGVAGTAAGGPPGGIAAATGTAGLLFGGSSYQDTYDKVLAKTGDKDKAHSAGLQVGAVQGLGEAAMTALGARFLTAAAPLVGKNTVAKALGRLKNPQTAKTFLKDTGLMVGAETSQEIVQDTSSEAIKAHYTGEETDLLKTAKETAGPAAAMTLMLAPFGIPARVLTDRRNTALVQTIENATADPLARLDAAMRVFGQLESIDKPEAQKWAAGVTKAIADGKAIDIRLAAQPQPGIQQTMDAKRQQVAAQGGDALDQAAASAGTATTVQSFQTPRPATMPNMAPGQHGQPLATSQPTGQPVARSLPVPQNLPVPQGRTYEPQVWPSRPAGLLEEPAPIDAEFIEVPLQITAPERRLLTYEPKPATGDRVVLPTGGAIELPMVQPRSDGKPFSTEKAAAAALRAQRLEGTHEVAHVAGGFVLRKIGTQQETEPGTDAETKPTQDVVSPAASAENDTVKTDIDPVSEASQPQAAPPADFDLAAAERAYSGTSIKPERAAEVELRQFEDYMANVEKSLMADAAEGSDVDAAIGRIRQAYLSNRQRVFSVREGALSSLVAGPSKFNIKQAGKRSDAVDRAEARFSEAMKLAVAREEQALGVSAAREAKQAAKAAERAEGTRQADLAAKQKRAAEIKLPIINEPENAHPITSEQWSKTPKDYKSVVVGDGYRYRSMIVNGSLTPVYLTDKKVVRRPQPAPEAAAETGPKVASESSQAQETKAPATEKPAIDTADIQEGDSITVNLGGKEYDRMTVLRIMKNGDFQIDWFGTKYIKPAEVLAFKKSVNRTAKERLEQEAQDRKQAAERDRLKAEESTRPKKIARPQQSPDRAELEDVPPFLERIRPFRQQAIENNNQIFTGELKPDGWETFGEWAGRGSSRSLDVATETEKAAEVEQQEKAAPDKTGDVASGAALDGMPSAGDTTAESGETDHLSAHEALMDGLRSGKVSLAEYKTAFAATLERMEEIEDAFSAMTKEAIFKRMGPHFRMVHRNDKKGELASAAAEDILGDFTIGRGLTIHFASDFRAASRRALVALVEGTTEKDLQDFAGQVQKEAAEFEQAVEARGKAIADPQTLDDYVLLLRSVMKESGKNFRQAYLELEPEQRAAYDRLSAEKSRKERGKSPEQVGSAAKTTTGEIIETKHTKTGEPLFVVQAGERVEREVYNQWNATARKLGGWYSSYRAGGAVPGFQFKTGKAAEAFRDYLAGETGAAQQLAQDRRDAFQDDRSQSAVERLNEMADRLDENAEAVLSADRKTNTARRAAMASRAEAAANSDKAMAQTMRNIAAAIEDGSAALLDRVRAKTQVELLSSLTNLAQDAALRQKYATAEERDRHRNDRVTADTASHAEFPRYEAFRSDLAALARKLIDNAGTKKIGQRLLKVADDVTDAYLKFARENTHKVSQFMRGSALADYTSREDAERAIKKAGLVGKAIVLPVKRGQNRIVLSPSEAIARGLWDGDSDKRLALREDFAVELIEAVGRRTRGVEVPWQLQTAHERVQALKRLGIESPAELRAALREFIALREGVKEPDRVKQLEREMVGRQKDGLDFFPTPASVADQLVETAAVEPGMSVLEPSAGMGHIAERIREAGVEPDVIELSGKRRELLEAKGFNIVGSDFVETQPGAGYDRIIMNPPFSDRRDAEHVRHAYDILKPGGRLVAIMGEGVFFGQDKKAQAFRDWLDEVGGTSEKLEDGTFLDPSLPVNTAVSARMVVVDKPASAGSAMHSRTTAPKTGNTVANVLSEITGRYKNGIAKLTKGGKLKIVQSAEDLPGDAKATGVSGVYFDGTIHLVADQIVKGEAVDVLRHEGLHLLMEQDKIFSAKKDALIVELKKARKIDKAVREAYGKVPQDTPAQHVDHEAMAYLVQHHKEHSMVKRLLAAVKAWLVRHGFPVGRMNAADFVALAEQGLRAHMRKNENMATGRETIFSMEDGNTHSGRSSFADPPQHEAAFVERGIEGKSLGQAAQFLIDNAPGQLAVIAEKVAARIAAAEKQGVRFTLNVVHAGDKVPPEMAYSRGLTNTLPGGKDVAVWIQGADMTGRVGTSYQTVLHEMVHAVTQVSLQAGREGSSAFRQDALRLRAVINSIASHAKKRIQEGGLTEYEQRLFMQDGNLHNTFQNMDEVLAWSMSSKEFQEYLDTVPSGSGTLWTRFVSAVKKLLGLGDNHSALTDLLTVAENLFDENKPWEVPAVLRQGTIANPASAGLVNSMEDGNNDTASVSPRSTSAEAVASVREDLQAKLGEAASADFAAVAIDGMENPALARETTRIVREAFGKEVVFYTGAAGSGSGFFHPQHPQWIFVRAETDPTATHLHIIGHELLHGLKAENPELYWKLASAIGDNVNDFDRYAEGSAQIDLFQDHVEEFIAELSGEQFTDPEFWRKLQAQDKSLFDRVVALVQRFIKKVTAVTDAFTTDANAVQDAIAAAFSEYSRVKTGRSDNKISFRRTSPPIEDLTAGVPRRTLSGGVQKLIRAVGKRTPEQLKSQLGRVVNSPWFASEFNPFKRNFVNLNLARSDSRHEIIHDIIQSDENYVGVEQMRRAVDRAPKEQAKKLWKAIKDGDRLKKVFSDEELAEQGLSPEMVGVYRSFRETINRANKVMFAKLKELSLIPYEGEEYFDRLKELVDENKSLKQAFADMGYDPELVAAHNTLKRLDNDLRHKLRKHKEEPWFDTMIEGLVQGRSIVEMQAEFGQMHEMMNVFREGRHLVEGRKTLKSYAKQPFADDLGRYLIDREAFKEFLAGHEANMDLAKAYQSVREYKSDLEQMKKEMGMLVGYAMRVRPDGDWLVRVFKTDADGKQVEVYMKTATTEHKAEVLSEKLKANVDFLKAELKSNYEADAEYTVRFDQAKNLDEEVFLSIGSDMSINALLDKAISGAQEGRVEQLEDVRDNVLRLVANNILARGFGKHKIRRSETFIEGYEDGNYLDSLQQYVGGLSGWLSKTEFAIRAQMSMREAINERPDDLRWAKVYVEDALRNTGYMDEIAASFRAYASLMFLGAKVSTAVLNSTQNYVLGQAELSRHGVKNPTRLILKAQKDVIAAAMGKRALISAEEERMLKQAVRSGRLRARQVDEAFGADELGRADGLGGVLGWLTGKAMIPFQAVEVYFNREPLLLASFRAFRQQGMSFESAMDKAQEVVSNTHFLIGKENRPEMVRKLGAVGVTAYTFQSYTHNALLWYANRIKAGELGAIGRSLAALAFLGGLAALPGLDDLDEWWKDAFGHSPEAELAKWLRENGDRYLGAGDALENFIMHGIPAAANVNFSRSLGISIPFLGGDADTLAERFGGVWPSLLYQRPKNAIDALTKGDYLRALENAPFTPEFIANPMRALRYHYGATTMSGQPITDENGRQLKYSDSETVLKMLGFNPLRVSKRHEARGDAYDLQAHWSDKKANLYAAYRNAETAQERLKVKRRILEFNGKLNRSQAAGLVKPITSKSLKQAMKPRQNRRQAYFMDQTLN